MSPSGHYSVAVPSCTQGLASGCRHLVSESAQLFVPWPVVLPCLQEGLWKYLMTFS